MKRNLPKDAPDANAKPTEGGKRAKKTSEEVKIAKPESPKIEISAGMEPVKPKKAGSGYLFFATGHSAMLRNDKGFSVVDAMKGAGAAWGVLTDAEKQKYNDMSEKDKQRYEKQTEEVNSKGYFILDDGSRSNEQKNLVKIKKDKSVASVKTKEHGTQTDKVLLAADLDYAGALKLAKSL